MTTLFEIAGAKLSLSLSATKMALKTDAAAILKKYAADGMLGSGNAINAVNERCLMAIRTIGDLTVVELGWTFDKTFFATPTTIDRCNAEAHKYMNSIAQECSAVLRETVQKCNGGERQLQETEPRQRAQEQQCRMALSLALDAMYTELTGKRARTILSGVQKLVLHVPKFLGLGH